MNALYPEAPQRTAIFDVEVFTPLQTRGINELISASDYPFVGTSFLIGDV
jgi:hypothetical protein